MADFTQPKSGNGNGAKPAGTVADILNREFPASLIYQKPKGGGRGMDYVEGSAIIRRLNEAFGHAWSFRILNVDYREAGKTEAIVTGELETPLGIKQDIGSDVHRGGNTELGDTTKSAVTDCIKRCARQLGVALHLYDKEGREGDEPTNGNGRSSHAAPRDDSGEAATGAQIDFIVATAKRCGLDVDHDGFTTPSGVGVPFDTLTKGHAAGYIAKLQAMEAAK